MRPGEVLAPKIVGGRDRARIVASQDLRQNVAFLLVCAPAGGPVLIERRNLLAIHLHLNVAPRERIVGQHAVLDPRIGSMPRRIIDVFVGGIARPGI